MSPELCLASLIKLSMLIPRFAPNFSDKDIAQCWCEHLACLPPEAFSVACRRAVDELDAFPSIRELKGLCGHAKRSAVEMVAEATIVVLTAMQTLNSDECMRLLTHNLLAAEIWARERGNTQRQGWLDGHLTEKDFAMLRSKIERTGKSVWRDATQGLLHNADAILKSAEPKPPRLKLL